MKQLMVWDSPNMNSALDEVVEERTERPVMRRVMSWLERQTDQEVMACVFVNVRNSSNPRFNAWLQKLQEDGFHLYLRPKDRDSDIDDAMVRVIREHIDDLSHVYIASHDARCFWPLIEELQGRGIGVTVIGYLERLTGYDNEQIKFVDLEQMPGVHRRPLERRALRLWELPPDGRLFEPSPRAIQRQQRRAKGGQPLEVCLDGISYSGYILPALKAAGITTRAELERKSNADLLAIRGIGPRYLAVIRARQTADK